MPNEVFKSISNRGYKPFNDVYLQNYAKREGLFKKVYRLPVKSRELTVKWS